MTKKRRKRRSRCEEGFENGKKKNDGRKKQVPDKPVFRKLPKISCVVTQKEQRRGR